MANTVTLNADGTGTVVLEGTSTDVASGSIDLARKELLSVVIAHAQRTHQVVDLLARDPQAEHMLRVHPDGTVTAGPTPPEPEELRLSVTPSETESASATTSPDPLDTSQPLLSHPGGEPHTATLPQEPVHTSAIPVGGLAEAAMEPRQTTQTNADYSPAPSYGEMTPAGVSATQPHISAEAGAAACELGSPAAPGVDSSVSISVSGAAEAPADTGSQDHDTQTWPASKADWQEYDPGSAVAQAQAGLSSREGDYRYDTAAQVTNDPYVTDLADPYPHEGLPAEGRESRNRSGSDMMPAQPTRNPNAQAAHATTGPHTAALATAPAAQTQPATSAEAVELDNELPPADAEPVPASGRSFLTVHEDNSPAESGWRGLLAKMGFNSEPSEDEKAYRADVRSVSSHWPGPRTIAIVNGKGGSGKTPTTVLLSAIFARYGGSGVLAWDNNETRGTLGWRTEQGTHESHVLTMLPRTNLLMEPTARAADLAAFVHHQTVDKFDVLRSNPAMLPHQQRLTAGNFDSVHAVASKYYRLVFVDSGNDETAPHWLRMVDHAHQIVVATTTRPDHAEAGRLLLEALRHRDPHSAELAEQAVVVVSQADREEASAKDIAAGFNGLARAAITVPYDRAMRAPWLRYDNLQRATQRAYLRVAASVASGL